MEAQNRIRKSATSIRTTQLIYLIIFIAVLQTSITVFRSGTLSDFGADNHLRSIQAPIHSKASPPSLAYRQSYGFFSDISDRNWKRLQQGAQRAHTLVEKDHRSVPETSTDSPSMWYPNDLEVSPLLTNLRAKRKTLSRLFYLLHTHTDNLFTAGLYLPPHEQGRRTRRWSYMDL
jgi:hypothetical protein